MTDSTLMCRRQLRHRKISGAESVPHGISGFYKNSLVGVFGLFHFCPLLDPAGYEAVLENAINLGEHTFGKPLIPF